MEEAEFAEAVTALEQKRGMDLQIQVNDEKQSKKRGFDLT